MERLTQKIDGLYLYDCDDYAIGKKLGQLEDIIEKYHIKDLDELESKIEYRNEYLIDYKVLEKALEICSQGYVDLVMGLEKDYFDLFDFPEELKNKEMYIKSVIEEAKKELEYK